MTEREDIAWADAEIARLRAAIAELEAFKRVSMAKASGVSASDYVQKSSVPLGRGRKKLSILKILSEGPAEGLTIKEIVTKLREKGLDSSAANTSPQLSMYGKGLGAVVKLDDGRWRLTKVGKLTVDHPI
jgi:hypothetical protein